MRLRKIMAEIRAAEIADGRRGRLTTSGVVIDRATSFSEKAVIHLSSQQATDQLWITAVTKARDAFQVAPDHVASFQFDRRDDNATVRVIGTNPDGTLRCLDLVMPQDDARTFVAVIEAQATARGAPRNHLAG